MATDAVCFLHGRGRSARNSLMFPAVLGQTPQTPSQSPHCSSNRESHCLIFCSIGPAPTPAPFTATELLSLADFPFSL